MGFLFGLFVGSAFGGSNSKTTPKKTHKRIIHHCRYNIPRYVIRECNEIKLLCELTVDQEKEKELEKIHKRYRWRPELEAALDIHEETWPEKAKEIEEEFWGLDHGTACAWVELADGCFI
jgi:hypothetical protein